MIDITHLTEITRSADHRYKYQGKWYPGTTGILKVLGATFSQAANYGAKHASLAAVDLANELPKMIETVGREGAAKAVASAGNNYRDKAAQKGTDIHGLADLVVRNQPIPVMADHIRDAVKAYAEWWAASGWTLRTSEAMLINVEMQYGGTLDLLARDKDGRTVLADIKTGGVYKEAVLQLAAYSGAEKIETDAGIYAMPTVDRHVILNVTADGVREIECTVGALERMAFAACRDLYDWSESMKGKRL